ncbi:alanine racemase [Moraxella bovoculi]|uniref:alanine racemase n=1 Tax=Moraxella bovoculi TaxID=386891 RepID=UPI00222E35BE|nr:alanine racemase [Moraxella bovoculi]
MCWHRQQRRGKSCPSSWLLSKIARVRLASVEDYVRERLALFKEQSSWLIKNAKLDRSKLTLHTANSFATIAVPESHLDMVRPGGLIYGDTIDANCL